MTMWRIVEHDRLCATGAPMNRRRRVLLLLLLLMLLHVLRRMRLDKTATGRGAVDDAIAAVAVCAAGRCRSVHMDVVELGCAIVLRSVNDCGA